MFRFANLLSSAFICVYLRLRIRLTIDGFLGIVARPCLDEALGQFIYCAVYVACRVIGPRSADDVFVPDARDRQLLVVLHPARGAKTEINICGADVLRQEHVDLYLQIPLRRFSGFGDLQTGLGQGELCGDAYDLSAETAAGGSSSTRTMIGLSPRVGASAEGAFAAGAEGRLLSAFFGAGARGAEALGTGAFGAGAP